jgi:hypothetical protein
VRADKYVNSGASGSGDCAGDHKRLVVPWSVLRMFCSSVLVVRIGSTLVFEFPVLETDVYEVSQDDMEDCGQICKHGSPVDSPGEGNVSSLVGDEITTLYYASSFAGIMPCAGLVGRFLHCEAGRRLIVHVIDRMFCYSCSTGNAAPHQHQDTTPVHHAFISALQNSNPELLVCSLCALDGLLMCTCYAADVLLMCS